METLQVKQTITIDIVSDVACPWCYIGKKNLEKAVDLLKDQFNYKIAFHPFQLDPSIPAEGMDSHAYFANKFGEAQLDQIFQRVESTGEKLGINFDFRGIVKAINTLPLHVILKVAATENIQLEVAKEFFESYMVHPKDMSDPAVIVEIMQKFGWEEEKTRRIMADTQLQAEVKEEIKKLHEMRISGVPFFIINNKFGVSGAQPTEMFVNAFHSLKPEDFPQQEDLSCAVVGTNC